MTMTTKTLDMAEYVYTHHAATSLYRLFFQGVLQAPNCYLSLGRAVERLSCDLEHLVAEIHSPKCAADATTAGEVLSIALYGVHPILVEVENTLVELHGSRQKNGRWRDPTVKIQLPEGDEKLGRLAEKIAFHCWVLEVASRTFKRTDAQKLLASIQPIAVAAHLKRLLYEQVDGFEEDPIIRRFDEMCTHGGRYLFADFRTESIVRIVMFWAFRAINGLSWLGEANVVSLDGYLSLLKAAWLLQKLRLVQTVTPIYVETKAVVALVSAELLFTFKVLEKAGSPPAREVIHRHGDFSIFPEHLVDECDPVAEIPTEKDQQLILEQEILDKLSDVSCRSSPSRASLASSISTTFTDPPPYSAVASEDSSTVPQPAGTAPLFPPPAVPQLVTRVKRKKPPHQLRVTTTVQGSEEVSMEIGAVQPLRDSKTKLPTPPSSAESQKGLPSGTNTVCINHSGTASQDPRDGENRIPSPTPSAIIDSIYCDSPTLGLEEDFDLSLRIRTPTSAQSSTGGPPSIRRDDSGLPPIHHPIASPLRPVQSMEPQKSNEITSDVISMRHDRPTTEEKITVSPPPFTSTQTSASDGRLVVQAHGHRAPSIGALIADDIGRWNVDFAIEYGVRPGEREVMPETFVPMKLMSSETRMGANDGAWENCVVRIFENQVRGEYRILTLRGKNVDQRIVKQSAAELVPEYGYHENRPIIFLREAGTGQDSIPPSPFKSRKSNNRKSGIKLSPITLYYKFFSLFDMFTFQQSLLDETVLADLANIRGIRYTRGFLSSETRHSKARLQLWRTIHPERDLSHHRTSALLQPSVSSRSSAPAEETILKPTRLVMYVDEIAISVFVTDDIGYFVPASSSKTLRIRPSCHRAFNNPSSVKACVLGSRNSPGGFRLDKDGMGIDRQESFEEFKWFEIEFQNEGECRALVADLDRALQERRRERIVVAELRRKAGRGVRAGEWWG